MSLRTAGLFSLASALALGVSLAQSGAPAPSSAKPATVPIPAKPSPGAGALDYSNESFVIQSYSTDITYAADGTGERVMTVRVKVQSDAALRQFGVIEFPYESRNEHLDFVYVRVRKRDGTVSPTPDTDAQDQPAEVTRQAPFYSDIRVKQLPVKSLSVGDVLEYQVRQVRTVAAAPGHFWYTQNFVTNQVVLEETDSLTVPKQKYVQVESATVQPVITESGENKVYRWKRSQLEKTKVADDKTKKNPVTVEEPPSIAVTTFKSWEDVGRWYGDLQKDRVTVTPAIQAKADELTKGIAAGGAGDEARMAAIYTYVATQYRYIGVAFGIGRYQPHSADEVMQNQYGDCKDKHTLLASLLKAAGYDAWPALVGSQHALQPKVPFPGQFDHVMTAVTLNHRVFWMDSTPEVAPFQMLFSGLRDKQVLGIPNGSTPGVMKTPANPPFDAFDRYEGSGTLAADGTLTAHFKITARGDDELLYRVGFHQTPRVQWQTLVQNVSYASGFAGTVSNIDASSPERLADPFTYSYDYTRKEYADWANRRILAVMPLVTFSYGEDDPKPVDTILLGGPVTYHFQSSIQLPAAYTAELPAPAKIQTDFAEYVASYSQADGKLVVERTLNLKQREIPVARWDEYIKFEKAVVDEAGSYIQLIGVGVKAAADRQPSNPEAAKLVQQAFENIKGRNFDLAKQELDQAAQLSPDEPELWGAYGFLDITQNRLDEGIRKYQKELKLHPDRFEMYRYLAGVQLYNKHPDDAIETLQALLKASPGDAKAQTQLASLLMQQKRYAEAIPLLTEAVARAPDDANLKAQLGNAEMRGGEKEKGIATLRDVLNTSNDQYVLNDAAYELADENVELPLARSSCEKALRLLDQASASTMLPTINDRDLQNVFYFAATWDTMAWILYRQGQLAEAEKFAYASWILNPSPTLGAHLGEIYEKQGKKVEAIHTYKLAIASRMAIGQPDGDPKARLTALNMPPENTAAETSKLDEELSSLRTVVVALPEHQHSSADFFVLLSAGPKVEATQYVNGDESMKAFEDKLKQAKFDLPFPPGSDARIVRRGTLFCSETPKRCQFTMRPPGTTTRN